MDLIWNDCRLIEENEWWLRWWGLIQLKKMVDLMIIRVDEDEDEDDDEH